MQFISAIENKLFKTGSFFSHFFFGVFGMEIVTQRVKGMRTLSNKDFIRIQHTCFKLPFDSAVVVLFSKFRVFNNASMASFSFVCILFHISNTDVCDLFVCYVEHIYTPSRL